MTSEIVRGGQHEPAPAEEVIFLEVERATLAKRRWRGVARDGREFGFDLEHALADGSAIFRLEGKCYVLAQKPEPLLEISLEDSPAHAALLGWRIGNLHLPIQIFGSVAYTPDDPAARQMLSREGVFFKTITGIFHPAARGGHAHHH